MSHPELMLDRQLCFLIYRLEKSVLEQYRPLLVDLGLTYPQYLAMLVLWEHGTVTVGSLCQYLRLDTGTVSPLLKRLQKTGYVTRTRNPNDERSVVVELTKAGQELEAKAAGVPRALATCLGVDLPEYQKLQTTLKALLSRLEVHG